MPPGLELSPLCPRGRAGGEAKVGKVDGWVGRVGRLVKRVVVLGQEWWLEALSRSIHLVQLLLSAYSSHIEVSLYNTKSVKYENRLGPLDGIHS